MATAIWGLPRTLHAGFLALSLAAAGPAVAHEGEEHGAAEPTATPEAGQMMEGDQGGMMGGGQQQGGQMPMMPGVERLMMPQMDPARGRKLFASKGCVACHAVNGVGGHDATPLDAHTMKRAMNPFEFAAKMWRMAPFMIQAQEEALGEQILFTGEELADIIAFVHDDAEQHKFSEADIPPEIEKLMHHTHGEGGAAAHEEELGHTHEGGEEDEHHD